MNLSGIVNHFLIKVIKPCIIFESSPVYSDNTKPVYDEMVKRGYEKKYHLFWYISNNDYASIDKFGNVEIWNKWKTKKLKEIIRSLCLRKKVKAVITSCEYIVPQPFDSCALAIHLTHGTPVKDTSSYYTIPKEYDFCISASEQVRDVMAYNCKFDRSKIVPLGYPRNDVFSQKKIDIKSVLKTNCDKVIAWYPTFKQHKNGTKTGCDFAIPIIHEKKSLAMLNDELRSNNIIIVLKPHPAQDLSFIRDIKLSNIVFLNNDFFVSKGISSYQFLASCDALLSDYSSVYCDFLLTGKPVGLIWEDIDSYKKKPGLCPQYKENAEGTYKIYNIDDLILFVRQIRTDYDPLIKERLCLRDRLNISTDGKNTKRVVDFIEKRL